MKKLSVLQIILLVIFWPVGICYLIYRLVKSSQSPTPQPSLDASGVDAGLKSEFDHAQYNVFEYKVVGVTFKSGKVPRQEILRNIHQHAPPFDKHIAVEVSQYDYNGEPALGVYANGQQIGNIGKTEVQKLMQHTTPGTTLALDVYGGGPASDGGKKNYGAMLKVLVPK